MSEQLKGLDAKIVMSETPKLWHRQAPGFPMRTRCGLIFTDKTRSTSHTLTDREPCMVCQGLPHGSLLNENSAEQRPPGQERLDDLRDPHGDILYRVIECGEPPTTEDVTWLSDRIDSLATAHQQSLERERALREAQDRLLGIIGEHCGFGSATYKRAEAFAANPSEEEAK